MKGTYAKQQFATMPPWAKGVIGIGALLIVGYVIYKIVRVPKTIKEGEGNRQEDKAVNDEFQKLINSGKPPTLNKTQMLAIANKLEVAMQGVGTDFPAIFNAFAQAKNYTDIVGIYQAYGRRTIKSGRLNPAPDLENATLSSALTDELDAQQIIQLNKLMALRKINHRF